MAQDFVLVSTDGDFSFLVEKISGAKVVIIRFCNYPTVIAAGVHRRNAIRIAHLANSEEHLITLEQ